MDNPSVESSAPLDTNQAASVFATLFSEEAPEKKPEAETPEAVETPVETPPTEDAEETLDETESEPEKFTVKIDGKDVEVTLDELKNGYQRQQDYTRKTMEVSEQRKQADAEFTKAREERFKYAEGLQQQHLMLQAALNEQSQIDWQQLLESDPVEYLKQQHLLQQRQAAQQKIQSDYQGLVEQQAEEARAYQSKFIAQQHEDLIAKLPEWKDAAKQKAEKAAIASYLKDTGFNDDDLSTLIDHRQVIVARKAMLYDQMIAKAKAATKQVQNVPQRVQKSGAGESPSLDKRGSAYQRLSKSGRVEDAAAVFSSLLS